MNKKNTPIDTGKKNITGTNSETQEHIINVQKLHGKDTTPAATAQEVTGISGKFLGVPNRLANLPDEILSLKRFFAVIITIDGDKVPAIKQWQKPDRQKYYSELANANFYGFDTCGHGRGEDYLMLDFDRVLDDNDEFVNEQAKIWYKWIQSRLGGYVERSVSGHGIRIFVKPTPEKFGKITNKDGLGVLHFDKDNPKIKLEIFYKTSKFSVVTGNIFDTTSREIPKGEVVDEVLDTLLNQIKLQHQAAKPAPKKKRKDPYKEFSSNTKELIDGINAITPEQLEAKGYLLRSEHGAPYPTGFICPWCGSGTHEHRTGALTYYENPNPHFTCHACSKGGDIIKFLSKIYGIDNRGEDFFTLIKKAADDFSIPYDKKIFEYRPAPMDGEARTQDFISDCPINLRIPTNFEFDKKGIRHITPPREGKDEPPKIKTVARTPLVITKVFTETKEFETQYEIAFLIGKKWRRITVEGNITSDPRYMHELTKKGALIEEPAFLTRYFSRLIAANYDELTKFKVYSQPGWHGDQFIYPSGDENYICNQRNVNYAELFATQGDADEWKKKLNEIICSNQGPLKRITLGAFYLSPMLKILHLPNFWLHLQGKKNYAKTPLIKFGLSAYGNPTETYLLRTFDSSPKNRVTMAVALNDLPQALDELETLSPKEAAELQKSVYDYVSGMDGQKNQKSGDVRAVKRFRGVRVSTGERPILEQNAKGGALKRCITLHVTETLFDDEDARQLHIFCEKHYGHFGKLWTDYIATNAAQIETDFNNIVADVQALAKEFEPAHVRAISGCAVGFWHFRHCLNLDSKFEFELARADAYLVIKNLPTQEEISDTNRGIDLLASWIDAHPKNFIVEKDNGDFISALNFSETSGIIFADGRVAFFPQPFKRIIETELHLPSYEKFLTELFDEGKIICKDRREKAKMIWIDKKSKRVYLFKAGVLVSFDEPTSEDSADENTD